jgi:hypothetical protein
MGRAKRKKKAINQRTLLVWSSVQQQASLHGALIFFYGKAENKQTEPMMFIRVDVQAPVGELMTVMTPAGLTSHSAHRMGAEKMV